MRISVLVALDRDYLSGDLDAFANQRAVAVALVSQGAVATVAEPCVLISDLVALRLNGKYRE